MCMEYLCSCLVSSIKVDKIYESVYVLSCSTNFSQIGVLAQQILYRSDIPLFYYSVLES